MLEAYFHDRYLSEHFVLHFDFQCIFHLYLQIYYQSCLTCGNECNNNNESPATLVTLTAFRAYFHLRQLGAAGVGPSCGGGGGGGHKAAPLDNPDQRLCDDVGAFCRCEPSGINPLGVCGEVWGGMASPTDDVSLSLRCR